MRKKIARLIVVATIYLAFFAISRTAFAQVPAKASVVINFPTFEGVNGGPTQTVDVIYAQVSGIIPGDFHASSGYCINTKIGYLCAPEDVDDLSGHATYDLAFELMPNGQVGSISGSFTVDYENTSGGTPLNLTVTYAATSN